MDHPSKRLRGEYKTYLSQGSFQLNPQLKNRLRQKLFKKSKILNDCYFSASQLLSSTQDSDEHLASPNDRYDISSNHQNSGDTESPEPMPGNEALGSDDEFTHNSSSDEDVPDNLPPSSAFEKKFSKHCSDKLYPAAQISQSESNLLLLSFTLRHKLTSACVDDLLKLMFLHLPPTTEFPKSAKQLKAKFGFKYDEATINYYCDVCETDFGSIPHTSCPKCQYTEVQNNSMNCYINFDIRSAISNILKLKEVVSSLKETFEKRKLNTNRYDDIYSGDNYKSLNLGPFDLTFTANTDGVPLFKSHKISLHPLLLSMNEISYPLRKKLTIVAALWTGFSSKPNYNIFFKSYIAQCNDLVENGLIWKLDTEMIRSKICFPVLVADAVAKCAVMGIRQFNGRYGCPYCLQKGETCRSWVYRPLSKEQLEPRTEANFVTHLQEFQQLLLDPSSVSVWGRGEPSHKGIMQASSLLKLKQFNIVESFVFDILHTCFLGITKRFMKIWLSSKNCHERFYLGGMIGEIDRRFLKCLVPFTCQRAPRSLEEIVHFKGHEYRTFMIVAPIILDTLLNEDYLKHFTLFSNSITQLCSEGLSGLQLDEIENSLFKFVADTEKLYGLQNCVFNVHLLLHCVNCVRMWGPLHSYSTFQFESFNEVILQSFKGTQHVPLQIAKKLLDISYARTINLESFENTEAQKLYDSLVNNKRQAKTATTINNVTLLGSGKSGVLFSDFDEDLELFGGNDNTYIFFQKAILHKKIYDVYERRTQRRCNSVIKVQSNLYLVQSFVYVQNRNLILVSVSDLKTTSIPNYVFGYKILEVSKKSRLLRADDILNFKYICILNETLEPSYLVQMPNVTELE